MDGINLSSVIPNIYNSLVDISNFSPCIIFFFIIPIVSSPCITCDVINCMGIFFFLIFSNSSAEKICCPRESI